MKWKVELYKKEDGNYPVLNFILLQSPKERAKIEREIDLLEEFGIYLPFPHTRKIEGPEYKSLWELRIKLATNAFRIFYFLYSGNVFILLHGIRKKTDRTPKKELYISKNHMIDYLRRN